MTSKLTGTDRKLNEKEWFIELPRQKNEHPGLHHYSAQSFNVQAPYKHHMLMHKTPLQSCLEIRGK